LSVVALLDKQQEIFIFKNSLHSDKLYFGHCGGLLEAGIELQLSSPHIFFSTKFADPLISSPKPRTVLQLEQRRPTAAITK